MSIYEELCEQINWQQMYEVRNIIVFNSFYCNEVCNILMLNNNDKNNLFSTNVQSTSKDIFLSTLNIDRTNLISQFDRYLVPKPYIVLYYNIQTFEKYENCFWYLIHSWVPTIIWKTTVVAILYSHFVMSISSLHISCKYFRSVA